MPAMNAGSCHWGGTLTPGGDNNSGRHRHSVSEAVLPFDKSAAQEEGKEGGAMETVTLMGGEDLRGGGASISPVSVVWGEPTAVPSRQSSEGLAAGHPLPGRDRFISAPLSLIPARGTWGMNAVVHVAKPSRRRAAGRGDRGIVSARGCTKFNCRLVLQGCRYQTEQISAAQGGGQWRESWAAGVGGEGSPVHQQKRTPESGWEAGAPARVDRGALHPQHECFVSEGMETDRARLGASARLCRTLRAGKAHAGIRSVPFCIKFLHRPTHRKG
jgi:hypothetical protein